MKYPIWVLTDFIVKRNAKSEMKICFQCFQNLKKKEVALLPETSLLHKGALPAVQMKMFIQTCKQNPGRSFWRLV